MICCLMEYTQSPVAIFLFSYISNENFTSKIVINLFQQCWMGSIKSISNILDFLIYKRSCSACTYCYLCISCFFMLLYSWFQLCRSFVIIGVADLMRLLFRFIHSVRIIMVTYCTINCDIMCCFFEYAESIKMQLLQLRQKTQTFLHAHKNGQKCTAYFYIN